VLATAAAVLSIALIGLHFVARTDWVKQEIQKRLTAGLEEATGGRVEIGDLDFSLFGRGLEIRQLTIHGTETPPAPPLLHIPVVRVRFGIDSLWEGRVSPRELQLLDPAAHIEVAADGASNLPKPPAAEGQPFGPGLFDIAVDLFEMDRGSVFWNGKRYGVSFLAQDLRVRTQFDHEGERYIARILLRDSSAEIGELRPLLSRGEADIWLYRDRIEIPNISLAAGDSQLSGDILLDGWRQPTAVANYEGRVDLPALAEWLDSDVIQRGAANIAGKANWDAGEEKLTYSGTASVAEASVKTAVGAVDRVAAQAEFSGDLNSFSVARFRIGIWGSSLTGSARVDNLQGPAAPRVRLEGEIQNVALDEIHAALDPASETFENIPWFETLPRFETLPWMSMLGARIEVDGEPENPRADLTLTLSAPDIAAPDEFSPGVSAPGVPVSRQPAPDIDPTGRTPLDGSIKLHYNISDRAAEIQRFELTTPHTHIEATGTVASNAHSVLHLAVNLSSMKDVAAWLEGTGRTLDDLPFQLNGDARVDGELRGNFLADGIQRAIFTGNLTVSNIHAQGYDIHRAAGQIELSDERLNVSEGSIEYDSARARVNLTLPLEGATIAPNRPLSAEIEIAGLDTQALLTKAGIDAPVRGRLEGRLAVRGSLASPTGEGRIEMRDVELRGDPFESLAGRFEFSKEKLTIQSLEVVRDGARVLVNAEFEPARKQLTFEAESADWPLAYLPVLAEAADRPSGALRFKITGSGRLGEGEELFENLEATGSWAVPDLTVSGKELGQFEGVVETVGDEVALNWQGNALAGTIEGRTRLQPRGSFNGQVEFKGIDAAALARMADIPLEQLTGELDGGCSFSGDALKLDELRASGEITRLEFALADIPGSENGYSISNVPFPMRWSLENQTLRLDRMRLLGPGPAGAPEQEGTDVEINGTVGLGGPGNFDLALTGTFNLAVAQSFDSNLRAAGVSTVRIKVTGDLNDPVVRGSMDVKNGTLRYGEFPNGLSGMNGRVNFSGKHVRIDELTAFTGGGRVRLSGNADFEGTARYSFSAEAERVRIGYQAVSTIVDGEFTLAGTDVQSLLSGDIVVERAALSPDIDLSAILASLGEPSATPASDPALSNMQLSVLVTSIPALRVETNLVRDMQTRIDLRVTGTALQPSLFGRVSVTQGQIVFQGARYFINRGDIDFVSPFRIEPVINFELETRVRDVDVALVLSGPARKMNLSYRSDPPLQFNELVSLITAGRAPSQDPVFASQQTIAQQGILQAGANTVLSNALSQPVSGRLRRFFGVNRLRVDPQIGGAEANPSARISTEQQLTNDLTLIYSYDLSSAQQQVVRVEWTPSRRFSLIFTRDENGLVGGDFLYKKRLR